MGVAVIYCRQSDPYGGAKSEGDDALSLEAQLEACRRHAAKLGLTVVAEFQEQFTGLSDQRPEYQKMLAQLRANGKAHKKGDPARIAHLVVYKWSRLTRDAATVVLLNNHFRQQGVTVETVADHQIGKSRYDELLVYTIATFNQFQVQDSIDFANNARQTLLDDGKLVCNGRARFGYEYDKRTRTRVVNEKNAEVVRKIFGWACEGHAAHKIMLLLQQEGIKSPSGRPRWGLKTIRDIIKDPSYKGAPMRVLKTERTPIDEGGGYHPCGSRKFRKAEGKEVGGPTPPIVSEEVWDKANGLVRERHRAPVRYNDWLVGRVWCQSCGVRLGRFEHSRRRYHYFRCPRHQLYKECKIRLGHALDKYVREDAERAIVQFLGDARVREAQLQALRDAIADPGWQEEHDRNLAEMEKIKKRIRLILRTFGDDPTMQEAQEEEIRRAQRDLKQREELQATHAERLTRSRAAAATTDKVRDWLADWPEWAKGRIAAYAFTEKMSEADRNRAADAVGLRVEVGRPANPADGKITVTVKVFDYEVTSTHPKPEPPEEKVEWVDVPGYEEKPSRGRSRAPPADPSGRIA